MSAGAFIFTKYTDNLDMVHVIQVQPETKALWEALGWSEPMADAAYPRAIVGGSRRKRGQLHARTVTIKSPTPPTGYKADSPITLPIPTQAVFNALPMPGENLGQPYLGDSDWVVVFVTAEVRR